MSNTTRPQRPPYRPRPYPQPQPQSSRLVYEREYWRQTADCIILWRTTDNLAARNKLLDAVADKCIEMLADYVAGKGPYPSIYHAHALVGGHECHCYNCERNRKLAGLGLNDQFLSEPNAAATGAITGQDH